jgi:N-acetylglutamate synthase-like GNAT family acetyltransferase
MRTIHRMRQTHAMSDSNQTFTERNFYLTEFRGRTLGLALSAGVQAGDAVLQTVLDDLSRNGTRVILLAADAATLAPFDAEPSHETGDSDWPGQLWRRLTQRPVVGLRLQPDQFEGAVAEVALRLRLSKLVWLRQGGGMLGVDGKRCSFMDAAELRGWRSAQPDPATEGEAAEQRLLAEIETLLDRGLPAVNVCDIDGLADELFTYTGSGTLFTRDRYADVRTLSVDEFDAARDLIDRGVEEGYLVARDERALERVLSGGIGVFIEGRYLAGVGSLLPHLGEGAAEIASLYTVTRYLGEGVGGQIVALAVARAQAGGYGYVFACTTSERVVSFFERNGFREVSGDEIPKTKWTGYAPDRRGSVRCMRRELG